MKTNMEIRIGGYVPASLLLEREPGQWNALAVLDTGKVPTGFLRAQAASYSYLHFDDVERPFPGKTSPSELLIDQGLEFAKGKDQLLVSCRAGQSRSPAIAYLICCQEMGVEEAVKVLDPTRHRPNPWVIEIGSAVLGNAEIRHQFQDWCKRNSHVKLSDYYDDMEKEFDALSALGAKDRITGV